MHSEIENFRFNNNYLYNIISCGSKNMLEFYKYDKIIAKKNHIKRKIKRLFNTMKLKNTKKYKL